MAIAIASALAGCSSAPEEDFAASVDEAITCANTVDWAQWRHSPRHSAYSPCTSSLGIANVSQLQVAWTKPSFRNPLVWNGSAYGSTPSAFQRVDSATGALRWQIEDSDGFGYRAVGFGKIILQEFFSLTARSTSDGALAYAKDRYGFVNFETPPPLFKGDRAYLLGITEASALHDEDDLGYLRSHLVSFDTSNGNLRWDVELRDVARFPSAPALAGVALFVPTAGGSLRTFDAESGAAGWVAATGAGSLSAPVVVHGRVFVNTKGHSDAPRLEAFSQKTGQLLWSVDSLSLRANNQGALAVSEDTVYVVAAAPEGGTDVSAFDAATGTLRFRVALAAGLPTAPALTPELLIFGTGDGHLHALNSATGEALADIPLRGASSVYGETLIADGRVFADTNVGLFVLSAP